jgi:hypothetical protein
MNSTLSADNADNIATKSGVNPFSLLGEPGVLGRGANAEDPRGRGEVAHPRVAVYRLCFSVLAGLEGRALAGREDVSLD